MQPFRLALVAAAALFAVPLVLLEAAGALTVPGAAVAALLGLFLVAVAAYFAATVAGRRSVPLP